MIVDKSSWHARLYLWWHAQKHPAYTAYFEGNTPQANLCPYVRAVLLWAPLRFLFRHRIMRWVSWPLLGLLGQLWLCLLGHKALHGELVVLVTTLGVLVVVTGIAGTMWGIGRLEQADPLKSFSRVLGARWQAAHDKICPTVEFK
jgi:hypothetical protein